MDNVELVGVHDDGEHLVLAGPDGSSFLLAIDEPLRAAVRRDRARLGQLQIAIDGSMRPKEIQSRIRAGMSAQELAEASGLPLEHVLRYEGPVMAERGHVADRARATAVQRSGSSATSLDDLVSQRLTARGVGGDRSWDAWREDGGWVVQVAFSAGGRARTGQWRYDPAGAHLEPVDDEARWLTARTEQEGPLGTADGRRLTAVKVQEKVYDVEADGGVRPSGEARSGGEARPGGGVRPGGEPASPPRDRTVDLLDALRGRRGRRQPVLQDDRTPTQGDLVDELLEGADAPPAAHPPASRPQEAVDAEVLALPDQPDDTTGEADPAPGRPPGGAPDEAPGEAPDRLPRGGRADQQEQPQDDASSGDGETGQVAPRQVRARSRQRRAAVPSWDDIVFGAKKD